MSSKERILRIEAPHFVAGSVWRKAGKLWYCVQAAPIIQWMVGKQPESVKEYLRLRRWRFQWVK